ncbi:uncharacterized protein LOC131166427 isoform X2 [Malania oleifera]|uniref:uncharacterized protein LOC131166427 isoform X2 n=1 Tax=Malania oleifera TaxID=397392 RepID=UPI0025AE12C9|nr:uncharacterized protein LOC131166427 isoform X2 [Malania oleifera]
MSTLSLELPTSPLSSLWKQLLGYKQVLSNRGNLLRTFLDLDISEYPKETPCICIIESKGLDEERQRQLLTCIQDKAIELSSCSMLIALCEEAVERLSLMNHPDGNCPLCLHHLVLDDDEDNILPFMKLMSCFHCFHSECIIRWWQWLQMEKVTDFRNSSPATIHPSRERKNSQDVPGIMEENVGNCPVCRKVFVTKDIEHVLELVGTCASKMSSSGNEVSDDEKLLQSDSEVFRRHKFETILRLQQENSGLIEPKRNEVLRPGMFLPESNTVPVTTLTGENHEQQHRGPTVSSETNLHGSSHMAGTSEHRNSGARKHRARYSRKPARQWIRKQNGTED